MSFVLVILLLVALCILLPVPLVLLLLLTSAERRRVLGLMVSRVAPVVLGLVVLGTMMMWGTRPVRVEPAPTVHHLATPHFVDNQAVVAPEATVFPPVLPPSAITSPPAPESVQLSDSGEIPVPSSVAPPQPPRNPNDAVSITSYTGDSPIGIELSKLPAWVDDAPSTAGSGPQFVLKSGRYATVEAAEAELVARLRTWLLEYLREQGLAIEPELLSPELLIGSGLRTGRLHEQFNLQVGEHTEPVYRASWQISMRPAVQQALTKPYAEALEARRLWQVGGIFGGLTLLFALGAGGMHYDDRTQGRHRKKLGIAAAVVLAGALTLVA
ncbi:MAG: hypothetical protein R3B90_16920 [Planctomycetaceae bacterium]